MPKAEMKEDGWMGWMGCSFLSCITFIFSFFALLLFVAFDFFHLAFPSFMFGIGKICLNAGRGRKKEER